jgi:uncharacterized protein YprB with RNaseH-like and TPR domain
MRELTLVHGIGKRQEQICHKCGILTLTDLRSTNWKIKAQKIAETILNGKQREIIELLRDTGCGTTQLLIWFVATASKENPLFFDIETSNKAHSPIILFGCGVCDGKTLRVTRYLIRNSSEEIAGLEFVTEIIRMQPILVTYNRKTFDLPCLVIRQTNENDVRNLRDVHERYLNEPPIIKNQKCHYYQYFTNLCRTTASDSTKILVNDQIVILQKHDKVGRRENAQQFSHYLR